MTEAECADRIADGAKRIREWRVANAQQRTEVAAKAERDKFWRDVEARTRPAVLAFKKG